ncbi:MAG: CvpA family protein [Bacteroidaceae bacterium]|nr:CvpA family protein [Bacteroidaceae bacterium]
MNTLDIVLLVVAGIGMLFGLKSGLIKQLSFGAGIAIGLLQATIFYPKAAAWLQELSGWDDIVCTILGFIIIILAVTIVINIAGLILRWLLKAVLLGWVDRILGAIFSIIIALGVVVLGVNISESIAPDNNITGKTSQKESLLYNEVAEVTFLIIEEAKKIDEKKEQYIKENSQQSL